MVYDKIIYGRHVDLRSVVAGDAQATLEMRQDAEKNRFLHPVENNLEKQKKWIEAQNRRADDYFFLALSKEGRPIGTFGIYEIEGIRAHAGRLLMYGNPLQSFEVSFLVFKFAFEYLGILEIWGDVDEKNTTARRFNEMLGLTFKKPVRDLELDRMVLYGSLMKDDFYKNLPFIGKRIYGEKPIPDMPWEQNKGKVNAAKNQR